MDLVASTGELWEVEQGLQSVSRELEPMVWSRGVARFVDPHGRPIPAAKATSSSFMEMVEPETYEVPAGVAGASLLALELTGLASGDRDGALNGLWFARRWGLLTHGPNTGAREPWGEMVETARSVRNLLDLRAALVADDPDLIATIHEGDFWRGVQRALGYPEVPRAGVGVQISKFIATAVSGGMAGCRTLVVSTAPGEFALSVRCPTLAARAYYEAATLLTARTPLRSCGASGCGRLFEVSDPRMKYCSARCREREKKRRVKLEEEVRDG